MGPANPAPVRPTESLEDLIARTKSESIMPEFDPQLPDDTTDVPPPLDWG